MGFQESYFEQDLYWGIQAFQLFLHLFWIYTLSRKLFSFENFDVRLLWSSFEIKKFLLSYQLCALFNFQYCLFLSFFHDGLCPDLLLLLISLKNIFGHHLSVFYVLSSINFVYSLLFIYSSSSSFYFLASLFECLVHLFLIILSFPFNTVKYVPYSSLMLFTLNCIF